MAQYFALMASLPMLKFEDTPPVTTESFFSSCSAWLKPPQMEELQALSIAPDEVVSDSPVPAIHPHKKSLAFRYTRWELALRNSIVRLRAARLSLDARSFERMAASFESDAESAAVAAYNAPNPLARERVLDAARWSKIEELEACQLFGYDRVCAYRLKLQILEKWAKRKAADAAANLDGAATRVQVPEPVKQEIQKQ